MRRTNRSLAFVIVALVLAGCGAPSPSPPASSLAPAMLPCSSNCVDVTLKLVLDQIGGAISNPDAQWFDRKKAETSPGYFMQNLRTLATETGQVSAITLRVNRESEIAKFVLQGQQLKWDVITAYLGNALENAWPATKWVGTGAQVVLGLFEPVTGGYGAAFEFCEPSSDPAEVRQAKQYITMMLQTYEPAPFRQIARRVTAGRKCADVMASYLATP